ncbi:helix-turn-helix domain-containing protein [Aneurinibacillus danicus]|uniref:HTH cro/C1-type domain-containing protein n=1 Tax=Aneurinibacillus danicus TaxID=267746 RepID=A0A511VAH7_9BACL|nr:helix-turn-helix transcriptional regulator [Aneurinibacillus danicus]GEN35927.1 hypothetical protein ADA01nite_33870 [Aneurinibacillus danicus]
MTIGKQLKYLRKRSKMKQADIAKILGITRSAYCSYENQRREPELSRLIAMADFYHISLDTLVGRKEKEWIVLEEEQELCDFLEKNTVIFAGNRLTPEQKGKLLKMAQIMLSDN